MIDFQIFECILGEGENSTKMAIIVGGLHTDNPTEAMNKVVSKYVGDAPHNQFVEMSLTNPWTRIIIENCGNLTYHTFESLERDKKIQEVLSS